VRTALAPPPRKARTTALGRFFGVYGDSRTWTALFYMLLALVTGVFYFTTVVTGLSMSAGLIVLIIGIPVFLLFVGFTRVLALAEGRLVEGLLGQRMPRRPVYPAKGVPIFERIKQMLVDRRTWTTMFYFLLMLPLGILYFVIAITGICVSVGLVGGSIAAVLMAFGVGGGSVTWDDPTVYYGPSPLAAPFLLIGGVLLLTAVLHLIRAIGRGHGTLAKHLLVARSDAAG
jgi:tryptophan-rich sensory protein